ncbi:MAG: 50S ribosomal protein L9 [Leptospiraceae bacterium]|nr:50S ribosomal protein L9 [Leptospiraceae bacterium]MCP5512074.1 50S ribosomal protein L9 [Leptospiraceae bacterium]
MKIVLQKDFPNLGDAGDIKEVADGYARNFLIPQKIAIRASEGSTKTALHQKKLIELKKEKRTKSMQELSKSISNKEVEIIVNVGENDKLFGSVTAQDIASALKKTGIEIDKRKIELNDSIKALGTFPVKIKLADGIHSTISVKVSKETQS